MDPTTITILGTVIAVAVVFGAGFGLCSKISSLEKQALSTRLEASQRRNEQLENYAEMVASHRKDWQREVEARGVALADPDPLRRLERVLDLYPDPAAADAPPAAPAAGHQA
jgi:hypothetical protein